MPLDFAPDTTWPPRETAEAMPYYTAWGAWFRGDMRELQDVYGQLNDTYAGPPFYRPRDERGLRGVLGRFWVGRPVQTAGQSRMHIPAAKDVATLGADLLFADPPALELPEGASDQQQQALDDLFNDGGIYSALHKAATLGGAYGGIFLRASANVELADGPVVDAIKPDTAWPEFYGPYLQSVTFWTVLSERGDSKVIRHLERHEMRQGKCVIYHGVFVGGPGRLGKPASLADYPQTQRFAQLVDDSGMIEVGTSKLDVVYVPNIQPHLDLSHSNFGRADYSGSEQQLDGLDETWSSLMRDIRIGKGRVFVPRQYISRLNPEGSGGLFDPEREIYAQLNAMPGDETGGKLALTAQQFAIRVAEHDATARGLWRIILRNAGMDGTEQDETNAPETATAVLGKASRKRGTRNVKIRYWTPQLRRLAFVLQELQGLYWRVPGTPMPPDVEWPDAAAPDMQTLAQTIQLLDAAGAISTRTKVEMLHPEWSEQQVQDEIALIEAGAPEPDAADPGDLGAPETDPSGDPLDDNAQLDPAAA